MRSIVPVFLVIFFIFAGSASVLAGEEDILIGRADEWPPFYYQENGRWEGSTIDAYRALTDEAGVKLKCQVLPWSRALNDMKVKKIILGDLAPTEERKKYMYFFGPHDTEIMGIAISVKYKDVSIKNLNDLTALSDKTGLKIIYQQDYHFSDEFNSRILSDRSFARHFRKKASLLKDSIRLVAEGRYLAYMEDKRSLAYFIRSRNLENSLTIHEYELNNSQVYFGVSKTVSENTRKKLEDADKRLREKGVYEKLKKKWRTMTNGPLN